MTHIDTLAHIQSRVRNGEKWELLVSPFPNEIWKAPEDQSLEALNRAVFHRKVRLAPKPACTVEEER